MNIHLCSPGHSGSTIIDLYLGSFANSASLGEIIQLPKNIALDSQCSCGQAIHACEFWAPVVNSLGERYQRKLWSTPYYLNYAFPVAGDVIDRSRQTRAYLLNRKVNYALYTLWLSTRFALFRTLAFQFERGVGQLEELYETVKSVHGVDVIVDSSKPYLKSLAIFERDTGRNRLVLLTRDPRGFAYSYVKRGGNFHRSVDDWRKFYERFFRITETIKASDEVLHLRYEDFVRDPQAAMSGILDSAGVSADKSDTVSHILAGNNARFSDVSTLRPDVGWREKISSDEERYVQRTCGDLINRFGYNE